MLTNQDMPPSQPIPFQRNGSSACIYFRNASPRFAYTLGKFHFYFAYVLGKIHSDFAYVLGKKLYLCNTNQRHNRYDTQAINRQFDRVEQTREQEASCSARSTTGWQDHAH